MSGDAFTGLRPVAKKRMGGELDRKTNRIFLPSTTGDGTDHPQVIEPPRVLPTPKPVVKKHFSLVPAAPTLLELVPRGVTLTSGWPVIGSNPSLDVPAFTALVLHLDGISRTHAAVTEFNDTPFVTDFGSTNGTRIFRDQQAIEVNEDPVELKPDDILWIGSVFFQVVRS
jgi:hypothetical protein